MSESASRTINVLWADRTGSTHPGFTDVLGHTPGMAATAKNDGDVDVAWYGVGPSSRNFTLVDAGAGISSFWFSVDEGAGAAACIEDQGGAGFALQDVVILSNSSCLAFGADGGAVARVDIAVSSSIYVVAVALC